jgi:hypothetical protein
MKKHSETISVTGMCRRAVDARFRSLNDPEWPAMRTKDEIDAAARLEEEIDAAIEAGPDTNLGGEIEEAVSAVLNRAIASGTHDADALAEAAVTDAKVLEAINRPGSAAVILRQLIGYALGPDEESDDDDEAPLAAILTDAELLRRLGGPA